MIVGDLVRHRFDGSYDEVGLVTDRRNFQGPGALISVMWCHSPLIREYHIRDLEVVNASR